MIMIPVYLFQQDLFLNPYQCACLWSIFCRLKSSSVRQQKYCKLKIQLKININMVNLNEINQSVCNMEPFIQ